MNITCFNNTTCLSFFTENLAFVISDDDPNKIYKATLPENIDSSTTLLFTTVYDFGEDSDHRGIAYDPVEKMLYWADNTNGVISRCDLNGESVESVDAVGKLSRPRS